MLHLFKLSFLFLLITLFSPFTLATPWFTGPLLAPAGHTTPKGHTNFEIYGLDVLTNGNYDESGKLRRARTFRSFVTNPIVTHGFTDWLDVQLTMPYVFNSSRSTDYNHLGDTAVAVGLQVLSQNKSPKRMDVRILVQETFPTGKFDHLSPDFFGTDSTGLGSYQTQLGINLQYLVEVFDSHYLRTRLILSRLYASSVKISGLNSYGGTKSTVGKINPGTENGIDLAFEYTLNQNWVAVMEGTYTKGQATRFNGIFDIGTIGGPTTDLGSGSYNSAALAPALEYNFTDSIGLIGGVWFPVSGKNTSHFMTYVLALNSFW